ncbi:hypothetical protein ACQJBY_013094 [Aegilops geniculata]
MTEKAMEVVGSAVAQEIVSRGFSFALSSPEKVSQEDLIERLEMAHIKLDGALERSRMMPITIMASLRLRKKLKDVFKECADLLGKARDRQNVVPSLRRKVMHAVLPTFIVPNQDVLSSSAVRKFELYANEAEKFVRDLESGCSLSHYRFLNPLIRHLLEGKNLSYNMVQGSQTCVLSIWTASVEEYGRVARLDFDYKDRGEPLRNFHLTLALRLYESTDILGVTAKCLQSLGPRFKSLADVATGELTQVCTQDVSYYDPVCSVIWRNVVGLTTGWSPDPFCCIENGPTKPCANNINSSELTGRFPQEVMFVSFDCRFSAFECSRSSNDEARINTIKTWPPLEMAVSFAPHLPDKHQRVSSLHQSEEEIQTKAINCFICHPEQTEFHMFWGSAHGYAIFHVQKPVTKARRASKRRR